MNKSTKNQDNTGVLPPLVSLKCQLCQQYLNDPVSLPCLHSFCRVCLEKYNSEKLRTSLPSNLSEEKTSEFEKEFPQTSETNEAEEEEKEGDFLTVACPTCLDILNLAPPQEPQIPFENSRLKRIVDLVRDSNVLCQNCTEAPSEVRCKTCNSWLCLECWEGTHSAPIFKTHLKEPLTHSEMFALPKCTQHPQNDLEFFSTEEEVGVCQVCLLKGDFVGKPYCMVSDVRRARQHEIEQAVKVVIEEKEKILVGQQRMKQVQELLENKLQTQTAAVKHNFAAIRSALDQREEETLKALEELKLTKKSVLEQQMAQTNHILQTINDGVQNVKLVLNHSNDLELVYLTIVLQEFVHDLAKIDAPKFGFKYQGQSKPLQYFHTAAVDSELPVTLSQKVVDLISAYAPVPTATFEPLQQKDTSEKVLGVSRGKLRLEQPKMTGEQKQVLQELGVEEQAEEGCVVV